MPLMGRRCILSDVERITKDNVSDVLTKAICKHTHIRAEINYLIRYEKGDQPILKREKEVRPEINNRIVENHASEIINFYRGYIFGSPIAYTQRATEDTNGSKTEKADNENISALNEMFFEESKASKDQQLAYDFLTCGVGYRMLLPKKKVLGVSPFDLIQLPCDRTFLIYSSSVYNNVLAGVVYYKDNGGVVHFTVYTDDEVFFVDGTHNSANIIVDVKPNKIGVIPIVEYKANYDRTGMFERALPLLDAINLNTSDRLNGLAQHVQSFVWMNNCEINSEQAKQLHDDLMLLTKNIDGTNQASVQYLTSPLNQDQEQTLKDDLYNQLLQITGVPNRETNTGGDTGQAVQLRNGFEIAESNAKSIELVFKECDKELLKVALQIIKKSNDIDIDMSNLKLSDIDIQSSRNRTDGLITKIQAFSQGVAAGIHPLHMLNIIGLFSDSHQVYIDSQPYLSKWKYDENDTEAEDENSV